jgi:hypothetical protein
MAGKENSGELGGEGTEILIQKGLKAWNSVPQPIKEDQCPKARKRCQCRRKKGEELMATYKQIQDYVRNIMDIPETC